MGNHYHLVVRFDELKELNRDELYRRASILYPNSGDKLDCWLKDRWERFNARIFDVSELMRQVQSTYARWFNRTFERKGRLWGDRFKSTLLEDEEAAFECLLYVELNPVRAGIVKRPEEFEGNSLFLREIESDRWMMHLGEMSGIRSRKAAVRDYRAAVYYRGNVRSKDEQAVISKRLIWEEEGRQFKPRGAYRKRLRYMVDGLAMGSAEYIQAQIEQMNKLGVYLRRAHPIRQRGTPHMTLREQRTHAVPI
jgi:hypothetical protein